MQPFFNMTNYFIGIDIAKHERVVSMYDYLTRERDEEMSA